MPPIEPPTNLQQPGFEGFSQRDADIATDLRTKADDELAKQIEEKGGLFAWIFRPVQEFFKSMFSVVWANWVKWFGPFFGPIISLFSDLTRTGSSTWHIQWIQNLADAGWLDKDDVEALTSMLGQTGIMSGTVQMLLNVMLTSRIVKTFQDVIGGTIIQKLNKTFSPSVPGPGDVLNVSFIAPELHNQVVEVLQRNGYSEDDIKLLFVSRYALHPPGDVAEMYLRGILSKEQADNRLRELGYTDERISEIEKSWVRIPQLPDVIRYLAKEAFEPAMIARFKLDADFPEESVEWAAKQGLDKKWATAEWVSHWRDPGLAPVIEAFHRGIVDWPYVEQYMSLIEIAPGLREVIAKSAYAVYTRVDVRRMYQLGVMGEAEVYRAYLDLGYDPEKAQNLTKFTVIDVASEDQPVTRKDVLDGFAAGDVTASEAEDLLVKVGFTAERADYLVYRAQMDQDRKARAATQKLIQDKYTANLIDEAQARSALLAAKTPLAKVSEMMDTWKVQVFKDQKLPSKTDLDKMYKAKIIDERTYRGELARLGYSLRYVDWYVEMASQGIAS